MGRMLQIRVMAETFKPEDLAEAWPNLVRLAPRGEAGVLELVDGLHDQVDYGSLEPEVKEALKSGVERGAYLKSQLEQALGDWQPAEADALTYKIEDLLDELEKKVSRD